MSKHHQTDVSRKVVGSEVCTVMVFCQRSCYLYADVALAFLVSASGVTDNNSNKGFFFFF